MSYHREEELPYNEPVRALYIVMTSGEHDLFRMAPKFIRLIIEGQLWKPMFKNFRQLLEWPLPDGLETSVDKIMMLVKDDPDLTIAVRKAMKSGKGGRPKKHCDSNKPNYNIMEFPRKDDEHSNQGTSKAYTLERLSDNHPELYAEVKTGTLSANKAAELAGFRKPTANHTVTVNGFAKAIRKHLTDDEIRELIRDLRLSVGLI
jgi:hypothetical protein